MIIIIILMILNQYDISNSNLSPKKKNISRIQIRKIQFLDKYRIYLISF